jgi:hypothetical protein
VESIASREVEDGILLLDSEMNRIHQLNHTARFIWDCCNGSTSATDIAKSLAQESEVSMEIAVRDVAETLDKLRAVSLVVEA